VTGVDKKLPRSVAGLRTAAGELLRGDGAGTDLVLDGLDELLARREVRLVDGVEDVGELLGAVGGTDLGVAFALDDLAPFDAPGESGRHPGHRRTLDVGTLAQFDGGLVLAFLVVVGHGRRFAAVLISAFGIPVAHRNNQATNRRISIRFSVTGPRTRLTETVGLDVPIVQAPVGSATCPDLAATVADAGALGMLAITWRDEATTSTLLAETTRQTDGTFGVNIVLDPDAKDVPTETHVDVCLSEGVEVFSFSFGNAAPYVDRVHSHDGIVLQSVGSAEEAANAAESGVDIVVAQGWEAGGHVQSDVSTMALVPRVVDAVPETPVVAAGGLADGRGIAAALTLGADGAWLGTRFLATEQARIHRLYRRRVLEAAETSTEFLTLFDEGWPDVPHRVLENSTVADWKAAGRPDSERPGEGDVVATVDDGTPVHRYEDSLAVPDVAGDVEELPLYAGQSAGLTDEVKSADELVADLADETIEALERATR